MAEENENQNDDDVAEEMMRMMQEEIGGEAGETPDAEAVETPDSGEEESGEDAADADLEAQMRLAIEAEDGEASAGGGESGDADLEAEMLQAMMAETSADTPEDAQQALQQTQAMLPGVDINTHNVVRLLEVKLSITIELGRTGVDIATLLAWSEGSLIELDKVSGEAVDVLINGKPYARGEVVTISENFGVRLIEILPALPRMI